MNIVLSPIRTDDVVSYSKKGDVITVNGEDFDFGPIKEGDRLPAKAISSFWFVGEVTRVEGVLLLTLFLPNPWNYSPEQAFPEPLLNVPDGVVVLPQPLPDPEPEGELENEGEPIDE